MNKATECNLHFVPKWTAGFNEINSQVIIMIGQTENGHFQTGSLDVLPKTEVIKVLRHVADMLEKEKHKIFKP